MVRKFRKYKWSEREKHFKRLDAIRTFAVNLSNRFIFGHKLHEIYPLSDIDFGAPVGVRRAVSGKSGTTSPAIFQEGHEQQRKNKTENPDKDADGKIQ